MSNASIETELADLKERVRKLENAAPPPSSHNWRAAFGALKGEPLFREAAKLGEDWRAQENKKP